MDPVEGRLWVLRLLLLLLLVSPPVKKFRMDERRRPAACAAAVEPGPIGGAENGAMWALLEVTVEAVVGVMPYP